MKSNTSATKVVFLIATLTLSVGAPAWAKEKKSKHVEPTQEVKAMPETAPAEAPSAPKRMAVGLSSADAFVLAPTSTYQVPALTGIIEMDARNLVQGFLAVPGASPFQFTLGGLFKHTIAENGAAGLHLGGGASLGLAPKSAASAIASGSSSSSTELFVKLGAVAGIHMPFPGTTNVMIHLDAGPVVHIQSGANDFAIGGFSGLLGASVLYYF